MAATVALVLTFRSSSNLSAAYGVAVNSTMAITTVLAFRVARERGGWGLPAALAFLTVFLSIDLTYLGANLTKVPQGGWFSLAVGIVFFTIMSTWRRGSQLVAARIQSETVPVDALLADIRETRPARVDGTAVFMTGWLKDTPPEVTHQLRLTKTLHKQVLLLTVLTEDIPKVKASERREIQRHDEGIWRVVLHYGYMQGPNIPSELKEPGLDISLDDTTYYVGHRTLAATRKHGGMAFWRDHLFAFMSRNSMKISSIYQIPADRVIEMGLQVRI